jgi:TetR/AcrR family acrAB operon transcriptional repressor
MRRSPAEAARTRRAVLTAALEVFGERGYAAATLGAIATRAGLTRGAVYHHFADKGELFLAAINENWAQAAGPVWAHLDEEDVEPRERIRRFLVAFFVALERDPVLRTVFRLTSQGGDFPELATGLHDKRRAMDLWLARLTELLARGGTGAGDGPASPRARSAALAIVSAANGAAATWLACPDLFSPADEARPLAEAILNGAFPETEGAA